MWSCKLLLRGQLASCEFIQFFIHAGKNTVLSGTNNSLGTRLGRYAVEMERGTRQIYSLEIWISNINRPANNCQGNSDISVKWRTKGGSVRVPEKGRTHCAWDGFQKSCTGQSPLSCVGKSKTLGSQVPGHCCYRDSSKLFSRPSRAAHETLPRPQTSGSI